MDPFASIRLLTRRHLRDQGTSRIEEYLGVRVYLVEGIKDISFGLSLLKGSAALLEATSPFWAKQVPKAFASIIIHDREYGPKYRYFHADRCWMVNQLSFSAMPAEERIVRFAVAVITFLCVRFLDKGRFGYFGVKNCHSITLRAIARFLRKCNTNGECSNQLSWCYQQIDKVRPGRRCYERFILDKRRKEMPSH